ncbi:hypothetical protein [Alkalimarinus sediminis]|uniref:Lipoprotein n=1 Tax=Alkalimarinus sediminis TaxID=1632866 RepID=A0A9E8HI40_9ALTE|nr:hypothetical protein [Alkalimarinus sediminis]UZW74829.1 hypothetical protein NNL22_17685 [Alkalimarinus sediminis]
MFKLKMLSQVVAATVASSFLVGCGGGSSSGTAASTTTNVSGSAFASYVSGARVVAMDGTAEIAGPVTTSATGRFTLPIPNEHLRSELVFVATGGTYIDEATGQEAASGELAVVAGANTLQAGSSIHATPSSTIIKMLMKKHGKTKDEAEKAFEEAFGYLPNTAVAPVDATKASDAADDAKLAGVRAGAFSQLLADLGLTKDDHAELLDVLAEDLADGALDGMNDTVTLQLKGKGIPADIANGFSMALMNFLDGKGKESGLNLGKVGLLKFNKKAVSDRYVFELEPPKMTKVGKAVYTLTITDLNDQPVANGTAVEMTPIMYMAGGHKHSTPHVGCSDVSGGKSTCTAYYLMASAMGNGDVMGNWELKFIVDNESVHFFPNVMMAMGDDTARLRIEGAAGDDDNIDGAARSYFIYKESMIENAGKYTVRFFVATKESMMSFPPLNDNGVAVTGGLSANVTLTVDGQPATFIANGIWQIADLDEAQLSDLELRLNVGAQDKPVGTFKITPSSM